MSLAELIGGRPGPLRRDLNLQNSLKPFLCQRTTVSGLTTIKTCRQLLQKRERITQKRRSLARSCGRLADRFIVASCWRSARFSKTISKVFLNPKRMLKSKFSVIFIIDEALQVYAKKSIISMLTDFWEVQLSVVISSKLKILCFLKVL